MQIMSDIKYIARVYDEITIEYEFNSIKLPLSIYFSGNCLHPDIKKIELIKKENELEKIIKIRENEQRY